MYSDPFYVEKNKCLMQTNTKIINHFQYNRNPCCQKFGHLHARVELVT